MAAEYEADLKRLSGSGGSRGSSSGGKRDREVDEAMGEEVKDTAYVEGGVSDFDDVNDREQVDTDNDRY